MHAKKKYHPNSLTAGLCISLATPCAPARGHESCLTWESEAPRFGRCLEVCGSLEVIQVCEAVNLYNVKSMVRRKRQSRSEDNRFFHSVASQFGGEE